MKITSFWTVPCAHTVLSTVLSLNQISGCKLRTNIKDHDTQHQ